MSRRMKKIGGQTTRFTRTRDLENPVRGILRLVCDAMREKGYNPVDQIVGYLASGDPIYITSHNGARNLLYYPGSGQTADICHLCK